MNRVFISHTHDDRALADAMREVIKAVFDKYVGVNHSSDMSASGGIPAGGDWLTWILDQVRQSQVTIVMLTPASVSKPWLMWESGAVSGVALATGDTLAIVPAVYRLSSDQVPSPLRGRQGVFGDTAEGILRLLQTIHSKTQEMDGRFFELAADRAIPHYLETVSKVLQDTPLPLTEAFIQEWIDRLEKYTRDRRFTETADLHQAILQSFTRANVDQDVPLDARLHRRLGEMYQACEKPRQAVAQFELALRLTPNDMFLIRNLADAQDAAGDREGTARTRKQIEALKEHWILPS